MKTKKWQLLTLIVIFVLGLVLVTAKSCRLMDRNSILVGQLDILKDQYKAMEKDTTSAILIARDYIIELKDGNAELNISVEKSETKILYKDIELSKLESDLIEARDTGDTDAIITSMEGQLTIWKVKFTLAEKIISNKDVIIFNLTEQYDSQLDISLDFEKLYLGGKDLLNRNEVLLNITERKLRTSRFGGTIKNVAVAILGGFVLFKIVGK